MSHRIDKLPSGRTIDSRRGEAHAKRTARNALAYDEAMAVSVAMRKAENCLKNVTGHLRIRNRRGVRAHLQNAVDALQQAIKDTTP